MLGGERMRKKCGARAKFTPEDEKLMAKLVEEFGENNWKTIASYFPNKTAKQCRDRWKNYADPKLNHGEWNVKEDNIVIDKYQEFGSSWSQISLFLKNRSPNDIRYRWIKLTQEMNCPTDYIDDERPIVKEVAQIEPPSQCFEPVEDFLKKLEEEFFLVEMSLQ